MRAWPREATRDGSGGHAHRLRTGRTREIRYAPTALGTNTDLYQPFERDLVITHAVLEVLAERIAGVRGSPIESFHSTPFW